MNRLRQLARLMLLPGIGLAGLLSATLVAGAGASDGAVGQAPAQIRFTYENPGLQPAKYVLTLLEDGSGHYSSEPGSAPSPDGQPWLVRSQDRQIAISRDMRDALFSAAQRARYFAGSCDDAGSKIAFTGKKTLEYTGVNGRGSCTYNRSNNKYIQLITDKCEGISLTLEEGGKLALEHEHARLSLDPELQTLSDLAKAGNALELENIAPVLSDIASDDAVLERARREARTLLDRSKNE